MTYLMMQMFLCLLIAFLLGVLFGWWLGRRGLQEKMQEIEDRGQRRHDECRNELESCRKERDRFGEERTSLNEQLAACQKDLETFRSQPATSDMAPVATEASVPSVGLADLGSPAEDPVAGRSELVVAAGVPVAGPVASAKDDLKKIEGIGPKIESLLNAKGVKTWAQLATSEVSFLRSVLDEAGPRFRMHDPGSWPRQSDLAAKGEWDELEALQDRLKGGREA